MQHYLSQAANLIWSYPVVGLCLLGAVFFSFRLAFIQLRGFPHAIALVMGKYDNPDETGEISHFQALSAALSGTVGIGNIGGVAIAIAIGGPGAVLWMWAIGFFGMATKYAECTLSTHYRTQDPTTGEVRGGPMYYMTEALGPKWKPFALFYALTIGVAGLGFACMFQTNQASTILQHYYSLPGYVTGILFVVLGALVILGGIRRIGKVAGTLVPLMCGIYLLAALIVCVLNWWKVPAAFGVIFYDGLTGQAAAGGSIGAVIQYGVRRAIFSNEAGLGSAAIAHAAVKTDYPIREGIVASLGPFLDTIVVSTATALVVILSGFYGSEMYQPKQTAPLVLSSRAGWSLATHKSFDKQAQLQTFRHGKQALHFKGKASASSLLTLPSKLTINDGLRFSYFRTSGDLEVRLLSLTGQVLAAVDVRNAKASKANTPALQAKHCAQQNRWASCVLLPNKALKKQLSPAKKGAKATPFRIAFLPKGQGEWQIDRIQSVRKAKGISLTAVAFDRYISGFGAIFVSFAGFLFAFSTLISWSYYGETGIAYAFGKASVLPYRLIFLVFAFIGAVQSLELVVSFSDALVGLLVIPNMIALIALSGKVSQWTKEYFDDLKSGKIKRTK